MTAAYLDAVRGVLGLPGHAAPQRHGFRRKGSSFPINTRGELAAVPELSGLSPCSTRAILEFPGQALLTPCCRVSAAANGEWLLLDAKDPLLLLETLAAQGLLAPAVCGRLREFAQLHPCFCPALRPGIGVLLRRDAQELLLAAQLLEGCGAVPEVFFLSDEHEPGADNPMPPALPAVLCPFAARLPYAPVNGAVLAGAGGQAGCGDRQPLRRRNHVLPLDP